MPEFKSVWDFFCWFCREMLKTLSNEPSYFSAKRIGRMCLFLNANIGLDICIHKLLISNLMTYEGACFIYAGQMVYAGYTTAQIFKEKPKTSISTETQNTSSLTTENIELEVK